MLSSQRLRRGECILRCVYHKGSPKFIRVSDGIILFAEQADIKLCGTHSEGCIPHAEAVARRAYDFDTSEKFTYGEPNQMVKDGFRTPIRRHSRCQGESGAEKSSLVLTMRAQRGRMAWDSGAESGFC